MHEPPDMSPDGVKISATLSGKAVRSGGGGFRNTKKRKNGKNGKTV
jgi:hypothetical protein